jgi:hypothetical protein
MSTVITDIISYSLDSSLVCFSLICIWFLIKAEPNIDNTILISNVNTVIAPQSQNETLKQKITTV